MSNTYTRFAGFGMETLLLLWENMF